MSDFRKPLRPGNGRSTSTRKEKQDRNGIAAADFADTALELVQDLVQAQKSHISDLRVLLDQSAAREGRLLELLEKGTLRCNGSTPGPATAPRSQAVQSAIQAETLSDVATFDEKSDGEHIAKENAKEQELEDEFKKLMREESEYREGRTVTAE